MRISCSGRQAGQQMPALGRFEPHWGRQAGVHQLWLLTAAPLQRTAATSIACPPALRWPAPGLRSQAAPGPRQQHPPKQRRQAAATSTHFELSQTVEDRVLVKGIRRVKVVVCGRKADGGSGRRRWPVCAGTPAAALLHRHSRCQLSRHPLPSRFTSFRSSSVRSRWVANHHTLQRLFLPLLAPPTPLTLDILQVLFCEIPIEGVLAEHHHALVCRRRWRGAGGRWVARQ